MSGATENLERDGLVDGFRTVMNKRDMLLFRVGNTS